jgi:hypothetical protein
MGKASSAKKVARAARAGGRGARGGQRRSLLFPATITVVCILGVSLILYARTQDKAEALEPGIGDHWHAAYGVDICGELQPPLSSGTADPNGIHTHDDGVMHIHPGAAQGVARAGEDATIQVFLQATGSSISDDSLTIRDAEGVETTYTEGDDSAPCDGQVQVAYWANADEANDTDPRVFTDDLADIFFKNDFEAYTFAFVPEGDDILPPDTVGDLAALAGVDGGASPTPSTVPGSSVPGGSTPTTAAGGGRGAPTTTAAGGPATTSTTAPPPG